MEEILASAAAALDAPEVLVRRSAEARAKAQGVPTESVLAAWGGGEAVAAPAAAPVAEPAEAPAAPADAPSAPAETGGPRVEVIGEEAPPVPDVVLDEEPPYESEEAAAAAGAMPRWLVALFVVVPAFAIAYALFFPNGPSCGDAGRLAVDPVSGVAVGCDGSPYGLSSTDFFAIGSAEYTTCAACHGEGGAGAGNFPGFTGGALLQTFPAGQCQQQVDWVTLGTADWPEPTYGATEKPVGGTGAVMPGFEGALSEERIRAVVLYERVQFGGQSFDEALVDCGLAEVDEATAGE
jgi:mono/diheme cytochrome c family protein